MKGKTKSNRVTEENVWEPLQYAIAYKTKLRITAGRWLRDIL